MRKYIKSFFTNSENGIETIEFIALTVVAAVLIAIVASIGENMADSALSVESTLDQDLDAMMQAIEGD